MITFDRVTLTVKGIEGHKWEVSIKEDGYGKFYLQNGITDMINHYKLKSKFCIVFNPISESILEIMMFNRFGVEINYGPPPNSTGVIKSSRTEFCKV